MSVLLKKNRWKLYLGIAGFAIIAISLGYTNYLAKNLVQREKASMEIWTQAYELFATEVSDEKDLSFYLSIIENNKHIPVILTDARGKITLSRNLGENPTPEYLDVQLKRFKNSGFEPIRIEFMGEVNYLYYKNSRIIDLLQYFPYFQLLFIIVLIGLGYLGFSNVRKAEQNLVWVGMAKETAHQLGTPISAMMAWVEHLKLTAQTDIAQQEIIKELENDIQRLELVAERFSKIGSSPELQPGNLLHELQKMKTYMEKRSPRAVRFDFPNPDDEPVLVLLNANLFDWVLENLLRNALDAMEGEGVISAKVYDDAKYIYVDISDTGKGIPDHLHKTIFRPGFTTRKRGWGLGLSLSRRIIENYHAGKIYVKHSEIGKGTTFAIRLPKEDLTFKQNAL
jgi:two-component sensor histidine kinase